GRYAADEREVRLLDVASFEERAHGRGALDVEGEREHAARPAIEAMHRVNADAEHLARDVGSDTRVVCPAAVHEQAGRLREDREGAARARSPAGHARARSATQADRATSATSSVRSVHVVFHRANGLCGRRVSSIDVASCLTTGPSMKPSPSPTRALARGPRS